MQSKLTVKGAREHNLKNVDIEIPGTSWWCLPACRDREKSSLAFDTIYAEGQRRYVESLSSYARQFLGQMEKPDVDYIEGLSPAISIDQKTTSKNPRSTVGTVTEIYDYLRLLYARIGIPALPHLRPGDQAADHGPDCRPGDGAEEGTRIQVLAPVVRGRKGSTPRNSEAARKSGYVRVRVDGNVYDLSETIPMEKNKNTPSRWWWTGWWSARTCGAVLADSVETATGLTGGLVTIDVGGEELPFFPELRLSRAWGMSMSELFPGCFPSTIPSVPVRNALDSVFSCPWTPTGSSRIGSCPSARALSAQAAGAMPTGAPLPRCITKG